MRKAKKITIKNVGVELENAVFVLIQVLAVKSTIWFNHVDFQQLFPNQNQHSDQDKPRPKHYL
jgi:pectate lyase